MEGILKILKKKKKGKREGLHRSYSSTNMQPSNIRHQTGRNLIDGTCLSPEPMDT